MPPLVACATMAWFSDTVTVIDCVAAGVVALGCTSEASAPGPAVICTASEFTPAAQLT